MSGCSRALGCEETLGKGAGQGSPHSCRAGEGSRILGGAPGAPRASRGCACPPAAHVHLLSASPDLGGGVNGHAALRTRSHVHTRHCPRRRIAAAPGRGPHGGSAQGHGGWSAEGVDVAADPSVTDPGSVRRAVSGVWPCHSATPGTLEATSSESLGFSRSANHRQAAF